MAQVRHLLSRKGSQVFSINPQAMVLDAARIMNEHQIGSLVIVERGRVAGIFTERDVLQRVVGARLDPGRTPVALVMTRQVICCRPQTPLEEVRGVFKSQRIRHMPVVDDHGRLCGLISIGDLNAWQLDGQAQEIHYLHEYIFGRV